MTYYDFLKSSLFYSGLGFLLAGAWARWLLQDQLLATGAILLGAWLVLRIADDIHL